MSWARETQFFRFRAFDPEAQIGLIKGLLNPQVNRSGDISHFCQQCIGVRSVAFQIVSDNLNVDGRRQSKIQNLSDHVSGQKVKGARREIAWAVSAEAGECNRPSDDDSADSVTRMSASDVPTGAELLYERLMPL